MFGINELEFIFKHRKLKLKFMLLKLKHLFECI